MMESLLSIRRAGADFIVTYLRKTQRKCWARTNQRDKLRMARIAIVGVGAIGGVTAALLQQAGRHELFLCTRRPMSRLSVDTPDGLVNVHAVFCGRPQRGD